MSVVETYAIVGVDTSMPVPQYSAVFLQRNFVVIVLASDFPRLRLGHLILPTEEIGFSMITELSPIVFIGFIGNPLLLTK